MGLNEGDFMNKIIDFFKNIKSTIIKSNILLIIFCMIILAGMYVTYHYSPKKGAKFIYEQF